MNTIKPNKLSHGSCIGLISPASSPDDLTRIEKATAYFNSLGYKVKTGRNTGKYYGYLAGTNEERIADITDMFADKEVQCIICLRGGYGSGRLLDKLPYQLVKDNPKIFVGYSDITAMHMAFLSQCGLVSFAGPMAAVDFWNERDDYTIPMFWDMVTKTRDEFVYPYPEGWKTETLTGGKAVGRIVGGNLALVLASLGTKYLPAFTDTILYFEDTGEEPYRVDRMLNQLKLAGVLDEVNGVIVGQLTDYEIKPDKKSLTMEEVLKTYLGGLGKPVLLNFPHGHVKKSATIPHGIMAKLDADAGKVALIESIVK